MSVIQNNLLMTPEGYQISRSVRLRSSASAYFSRTPAGYGASTQTMSFWFKRGNVSGSAVNPIRSSYYDANNYSVIAFDVSAGKLTILQVENGTTVCNKATNAVYRDPSAWYHVVVNTDLSRSSGDKNRIYVNGVLQSCTGTDNQVYQLWPYTAYTQVIGYAWASGTYLDGYLTEVNFIDGQALTPSSFGETDAVTGVWKPKKYAGTYGTNGFYLNFSDPSAATAAAIGKDSSGNGNNWTPNNISVTAGVTYDSMLDVPTMYADGGNGRGNYATLNPLGKASSATLANGNLSLSNGTFNTYPAVSTGIYPASGSWYFEAEFTGSGTQECSVGMSNLTTFASLTHQTAAGNVFWNSNNGIYKDGAVFSGGAGKTFTYGDVIGVAYDIAAGTITFYKNGVAQTPVVTGVGASYSPTLGFNYYTAGVLHLNCGQRPFAYTPPTGFKALNTQNLPAPTILNGNKYFDVALHTGNGGTTNVTSLNFQPDLVWIKARSNAANHGIIDSVRGVAKQLSSSLTAAELDITDGMQSFNSNGFTVQNETDGYSLNTNGYTYADWCWKESVTAGFDIVTYTGTGAAQNVAHSLGVAPKMMIVKTRSTTGAWGVYHGSLTSSQVLYLNLTDSVDGSGIWNNTAPTSSVFSVGAHPTSNPSGQTLVAYLFAEVAGYSKFGSVTMNGSADGAFVFTGFLPKLVMLKRTDSTSNWIMWDTVRNTYNVVGAELYPNLSNAESTVTDMDILSNGFKMRNSGFSGTWIYAAWADAPFKNSLAR